MNTLIYYTLCLYRNDSADGYVIVNRSSLCSG